MMMSVKEGKRDFSSSFLTYCFRTSYLALDGFIMALLFLKLLGIKGCFVRIFVDFHKIRGIVKERIVSRLRVRESNRRI